MERWCGGARVWIPTCRADPRRIGGPRASISANQATIAVGAGGAKLRMLRCVRGLGRSPSIEAPQGIFFSGR